MPTAQDNPSGRSAASDLKIAPRSGNAVRISSGHHMSTGTPLSWLPAPPSGHANVFDTTHTHADRRIDHDHYPVGGTDR